MNNKKNALYFGILVWSIVGCSHDERRHENSALADCVIDGAGIGVVVDEIRKRASLPVSAEMFLRKYRVGFTTQWTIRTNNHNWLELSRFGIVRWTINQTNGLVRLAGTADPKNISFVQKLRQVDFSQPLSHSDISAVNPDMATLLKERADFIWSYYDTAKEPEPQQTTDGKQ